MAVHSRMSRNAVDGKSTRRFGYGYTKQIRLSREKAINVSHIFLLDFQIFQILRKFHVRRIVHRTFDNAGNILCKGLAQGSRQVFRAFDAACGNVIKTRSTKKEMTVNTCSACHPYFTGQKTMVDTEGRVDSFKKRYAKFAK